MHGSVTDYLYLLGHYISDVYDVKTNQWTRYDDITAKKVLTMKRMYCTLVNANLKSPGCVIGLPFSAVYYFYSIYELP